MIVQPVTFHASCVEIFSAVCNQPGSFFLDSALAADGLGEFSFIGCDPYLMIRASGDAVTLTQGGRVETRRRDPLLELRELLQRHPAPAAAPLPFAGGAVGYFSYECGHRFERIVRTTPSDLDVPEMEFGFYDAVLAFPSETGRAFVVANPADVSRERIVAQKLERTVRDALARRARARSEPPSRLALEPPRSNFTKGEYLRAIARIKEYIRAGDVYQVNLSQRFEMSLPCHPCELYWRLRQMSPAPFGGYLNFGERQIVSCSPERFLRLQNGRVETRPIKGTRPRGSNPAEDDVLRQELIASEKDRAELLMIVDLERNDLGRVCEVGSIRVDEIYRLETHPTVFHLGATVSGKLPAQADVFDCLRAAFPGGSITGAPKIRAMQIIDELEPHRRHVYTGAIGHLGFNGNCDLNIAIRTILCTNGRAYYHVGGGIIWDSDPESEYQETLDKGRAMHAALAAQPSFIP
jgi:para-aminobenzoate synthetase component 1